jgi:hypothetical protein
VRPRRRGSTAAVVAAAAIVQAACGSSTHHHTHTQAQLATTGTTTHSTAPAHHAKPKKRSRTTPGRSASNHTKTPARTTPNATRTNTAPSPSPANGLRPSGSYAMYELCSGHCTGSVPAALERPLRLPGLGPGRSCPVSRGSGPVEPPRSPNLKLTRFQGSAWQGAEVTWRSAPGYHGPVLIRGRQLGGAGVVGFGEGHVPYDQLQLLDPAQGTPRGPGRTWPSFTRVKAPGCYAYQVDGTSFSYVIVYRAS